MKLHLSIIYSNHVSKCTIYGCEICINFVNQQSALNWTTKEMMVKSKSNSRILNRRKGLIKARKGSRKLSRKTVNPEQEDPTYEPPVSYFKTWKRKSNSYWRNREPLEMLKPSVIPTLESLRGCSIVLENLQKLNESIERPQSKLQRSKSEPNLTSCKNLRLEINKKYAQDDILVKYISKMSMIKSMSKLMCNNKRICSWKNIFEASSKITRFSDKRYSTSGPLTVPLAQTRQGLGSAGGKLQYRWHDNWQRQCFPGAVKDKCFPASLTIPVGYTCTTESSKTQIPVQPVSMSNEMQYPPALYLEKGCSCKESCRTMECPCARAGVLCRSGIGCICKECDNPLNIMHKFELDIILARVDECLMQKLYSYEAPELFKLISSEVVLPCCRTATKLQRIVPSTVICNCCGNAVSYSWCTQTVHVQTVCPRNHCLVCCACKPTLHTHCQNCQQCTPSGNQGTCMECGVVKLFAV